MKRDRFDCGHAVTARRVGQERSAEHDDLDAELARRSDLSIRRVTATVLADNRIYSLASKQHSLVGDVERPTRQDIIDVGHGQWRHHRVHAAHDVMMLRGTLERRNLLPSERQKRAAGHGAQCLNGLRDRRDFSPSIAFGRGPARTAKSDDRNVGELRGAGGIGGNARGVGMRGVDQQFDRIIRKIGCETVGSAKTAAPDGNALLNRVRSPARERKRYRNALSGQSYSQLPCLSGSAEDQYWVSHDACC